LYLSHQRGQAFKEEIIRMDSLEAVAIVKVASSLHSFNFKAQTHSE
jgi:hypothetical protein